MHPCFGRHFEATRCLDVWPCTFVGSWSNYNVHRSPETRKAILAGRWKTQKHLQLFRQLFEMQSTRCLGCHGENPEGSLAFEDPAIQNLSRNHSVYWAKFPQCSVGLKHPATAEPMLKVTEVITTDSAVADSLNGHTSLCVKQPNKPLHARVGGTFEGRNVSSWAEDCPTELAKQMLSGLIRARYERQQRHDLFEERGRQAE